jgi:signal transduction histidine kinase
MGVLRDVREISRGIHRVILSEPGLEPVVKGLARRLPVPVDLTVRVAGRLPDQIGLGAYYIVSEALANVAKHAHAETVTVSVEAVLGVLSLSVRDDGVGGADRTAQD